MKKQGRGYIWTEQEEQHLKENYSSHKLDDLVVYFNRTKTAIMAKAKKLGLRINKEQADYHRVWTKADEDYLVKHYKFGNVKDIAKHLNRTKKAITERAKLLKITRDPETARIQGRKHAIDDYFFSQWSQDMAYVLGLICSDGNLAKDSYAISITLHLNDKYLLEDILKKLNSSHSVGIPINKNMCYIAFNNKQMYNDLLKLNIIPNKSKIFKCPNVPKAHIPSFIRGLLDGDGSVDAKNKRMKIVSASKDFIYGVSNLLSSININNKVYNEPYIYNGVKTDFYAIRVLRRRDIKKIYNAMYHNTNLYLKRKKQSFLKMGVESDDFTIKCKKSMRPIMGKNDKETIRFGSVKEARRNGFPRIFDALTDGKKYKGYTWKYQ